MSNVMDFNEAFKEKELEQFLSSEFDEGQREKVLSGLSSSIESFIVWLFPSAIITPKKALVGDIRGNPGGSLVIQTSGSKKGVWSDFADPSQKGGNLIDLYIAARGISFKDALNELSDWVGNGTKPEVNYQREQLAKKAKRVQRDLGQQKGEWHYTDEDGVIIASIYRYEPEEGQKEYLPWNAVAGRYGLPDIRPLYNIPGVLKSDTVVFCEGEKAADALIRQDICATAVMGGSNSPLERTNLLPLKGKKVIIWPDADEAGLKFAGAIASALDGLCEVTQIEIPEDAPKGWDAADADNAPEILGHEVAPIDPYELKVVDAFDFDEAKIPPRPWIIPGVMLAGYTHMLAAPGGSGKSLFTLQLAIALATGDKWGEFEPRHRAKTLVINVEDDLDEQRRRLSAAREVMKPDDKLLPGMIHLVNAADSIVIAGHDATKKTIVATPIVETLCRYIETHNIEVLIVDPFAETFEGNENDNSEVKWAMQIWRDQIAKRTGCAVYLVHHTTKNAGGGAGDQNIVRGGGAIVNSTRISSTLMPMTVEECEAVGVEKEDVHYYVRFDDAKANQSLKSGKARWFKKQSVLLRNGTSGLEGDEVGALIPWTQEDPFDGISIKMINQALDYIDEGYVDANGVVTERRYTLETKGGSTKPGGRWVGLILMQEFKIKLARAKIILRHWERNGVLVSKPYRDPVQRKDTNGVFVAEDKRPGEVR
jgi:5S rRNA maturation endonuclease (ribonuclease M5)